MSITTDADPSMTSAAPGADAALGAGLARVCLVAGPEAIPAAEGAAAALRADGHAVVVVPFDDLPPLATADAVLVLGGTGLEAAARAVAPAHADVVAELLEGSAARWEDLVLRAARSLASVAELRLAPPPHVPEFVQDFLELCG